MSSPCSSSTVEAVGAVLNDCTKSLDERFRALFTLRGIGTRKAIDQISKCFNDTSVLLKHECAYCLGQIGDVGALPVLTSVLEDIQQDPMVRHEAGEALGAIGDSSAKDILSKYSTDSSSEVSETCQIALQRLRWLEARDKETLLDTNPYFSVDPAPPLNCGDIREWHELLNNTSESMFMRYRALFSLRNHGGRDAALALATGLKDSSALFKHEIAYVLGQMKEPAAIPALTQSLRDLSENAMVRHECAEALGSIATEECMVTLEEFRRDEERVVRESCEVAMDMLAHEKSQDFQYANTISHITPATS